MAYKFKPNKSMKKRFKVTKTGKLKRGHGFTSHLMSARPSKRRRKLDRPAIVFEGIARSLRKAMGLAGLKPKKVAHQRALKAKAKAKALATAVAA